MTRSRFVADPPARVRHLRLLSAFATLALFATIDNS